MGYDYNNNLFSSNAMASGPDFGIGSIIWIIISLIIALVGCFLIYFMFVNKDHKESNKKLAWLKSFLRFDKMLIETILKIAYIFAAICITLVPLAFITSFGSFIGILIFIVFGNLITRVIYELSLIKVMIWKNTTEIKNKLK